MTPDSGLALLLAEDFDRRAAPPAPDIEALLAQTREQARAEWAAALDARAVAAQEALARACAALAANLAPALDSLDSALAEIACSLSETMIVAIEAALPGWSRGLAPGIGAEISATLLRALGEGAAPRLAAAPADAEALRPLLPPEIALEPDDTMAPGALRFTWRDGRAMRDPAAIWNDIITTLLPALDAAEPLPAMPAPE